REAFRFLRCRPQPSRLCRGRSCADRARPQRQPKGRRGLAAPRTVKPRIAITAGDPAGIGPEIARKAADDRRVRELCEPVIYAAPAGSRFEPGVLSAEAGRAAYNSIC